MVYCHTYFYKGTSDQKIEPLKNLKYRMKTQVKAVQRKMIVYVVAPHGIDPKEKPCIIYNYIKKKGQAKRYRVREVKQAKQLLLAMEFFKDDVFTRCAVIRNEGDVFAADIMYHCNCLSSRILRFKRGLRQLINDQDDLDETDIDGEAEIFENAIKDINLKYHAVYISTIRDSMNSKFQEQSGGIQF